MLHKWKENSMLVKALAACTYLYSIVSELYDAYLSQCVLVQKSLFFNDIFVSAGDAPGAITLNVWMEREFDAYNLSHSVYPSILNSFPVIRTASAKNRRFHVPQPTFLFPLEPLRLSRNMLHKWKENSMLAKPLAACIYLYSIVFELYDA